MADYRAAVRHLKRVDPVMAGIITHVGPCRFTVAEHIPYYAYLVRAIIYQQLSTKAAATIYGRVGALCGATEPTAESVTRADDAALRAAGVSPQKLGYLRDLTARTLDGALDLTHIHAMDDEPAITALTQVKGIGRWSAHMFLMFRLGRLDVLPDLDLGIQNAMQRAYRMRRRPSPERVRKVGTPWSPFATIACWYLWRSIDGPAGA